MLVIENIGSADQDKQLNERMKSGQSKDHQISAQSTKIKHDQNYSKIIRSLSSWFKFSNDPKETSELPIKSLSVCNIEMKHPENELSFGLSHGFQLNIYSIIFKKLFFYFILIVFSL